ncbi:MAG: hypothetical protein JXB50_01000 [Spirochaetes bacterium]|nr:hypothetical protein [Spirochaetota bacterium]
MKKFLFAIFLFCTLIIYPQDKSNTVLKNTKSGSWRFQSNKFRLDSIAKDLIKADLNQLKAIAMSLGIGEMNTAAEYRKAIADYYKIELITQAIQKQGDKIQITNAGELKYMKFVEEDEENLHLLGRAKIEMSSKNENGDTVQRYIEADEIYINTKNKEITGIGNVHYKDDRLDYVGDQFYYNYDLNRGVLFSGRTQLIKGGESGLDGAFFKGEKVLQTGDDNIILQNGMLTTCEEQNPHYYMKVSRLWVGEKGEWGLLNGVVYIGPVPFFYFPIYYHPKELIVNPSFGFKARHGWYINTTYYVFGEKSSSETEPNQQTTSETGSATFSSRTLIQQRRSVPTSFFRITREEINRQLDDYYSNSDFYSKHPNLKTYPKFDSMEIALNLFSDAYTNLGFYTGLFFYFKTDFPNNTLKLMMLTDFAFSRKVWKDPVLNSYYPYIPDDDKISELAENPFYTNSYYNLFIYNPLIFRQSQWVKFDGALLRNKINFNYDFQVEYASDKFYFLDFYNRRQEFTYIEILADAISSAINQQESSSFKSTTEDSDITDDYNNIRTYLKLNISPLSSNLPNIFGLPVVSRLNLNLESNVLFTNTVIPSVNETETKASYHNPRSERFLLSYFSFPGALSDNGSELATNTLSIAGTLVDYDVFLSMPEKYNRYKEEKKNKELLKEDKILKELFNDIDEINKIDNTSDNTVINFKKLLPFYSKKTLSDAKSGEQTTKYKFNNIYSFEESYKIKTEEEKKIVESADLKSKNYKEISIIEKIEKTQSSLMIKPFETSLKYEANERIVNKFIFDQTTDILKLDNSAEDTVQDRLNRDEYDTLQAFFYAGFNENYYINFPSFLKRMNLRNFLEFKLENPLKILMFNNLGVLEIKPTLKILTRRYWDNENFYYHYLYENYNFAVDSLKEKQDIIFYEINDKVRKENRSVSDLVINYSDSIVNNLSFGLYEITGTGIRTNVDVDIFQYKHFKEHNYRLFNEINGFKSPYEDDLNLSYNYRYYVDPIFYYNRISYDRINTLDTTLTFKYNILPQESSHKLDMALSTKINWKIPSATLQELKDELWLENNSDYHIRYLNASSTVNVEAEAREFIYYRNNEGEKRYGNYNLIDKIWGAYYGNFFTKYKYFRKMFDNVTYSLNYGFKYKTTQVVNVTYNLIFVLDNIGAFSDVVYLKEGSNNYKVGVSPYSFSVYPNHLLSLNFFNSMLSYTLNISFKKVNNPFFTNLTPIPTTKDYRLDDYNIMTMDKNHSFNFKLPGNIFKMPDNTFTAKISASNWVNLGTTLTYKWDKTLSGIASGIAKKDDNIWSDASKYNFFYLDSQIITFSTILDILKISLTFKKYNFANTGYGLELEKGSIYLGYNITEIPVFFRFFKFSIFPQLIFNFTLRHERYFENKALYEYSSEYNTYNSMNVKLDLNLEIAKGTNFETNFRFSIESENRKMYTYYKEDGIEEFFKDIANSFDFSDTEKRRKANFKLKRITFSIEHYICDWKMEFLYIGEPVKEDKKYTWENMFEFHVTWRVQTKNQLIKMFNKTKVNAVYNRDENNYSTGEWQQPILSLDPDEE